MILPPNPNAETVDAATLLNAAIGFIVSQGAAATEPALVSYVTGATGESEVSFQWRFDLFVQELAKLGTISAETFDALKTWAIDPARTSAQLNAQGAAVLANITHLSALVSEKAANEALVAAADACLAKALATDADLWLSWGALLDGSTPPAEFVDLIVIELDARDQLATQQSAAPQRKAIAEARIAAIDIELGG